MNGTEELRALIREVIREAVRETGMVETVNLSTDQDLAVFVTRLIDLDPAERDDLRSGRKRFRLAAPAPPSMPMAPSSPLEHADPATVPASGGRAGGRSAGDLAGVRRIERGAVTEGMVRDAARAGERLMLGPGAVLTPLARDRARASGVRIEKER